MIRLPPSSRPGPPPGLHRLLTAPLVGAMTVIASAIAMALQGALHDPLRTGWLLALAAVGGAVAGAMVGGGPRRLVVPSAALASTATCVLLVLRWARWADAGVGRYLLRWLPLAAPLLLGLCLLSAAAGAWLRTRLED
ncbi:MAG: hypothetical protein Q9Q40_04050 [Acidobacteriota bacterium]|nr:hypothetical protein [Acidobacteriota bacterium]MDQ7088214.1 hypothetical protein [Acidobacteriota bacterium]